MPLTHDDVVTILQKVVCHAPRRFGDGDVLAWQEALNIRGVELADALWAVGQWGAHRAPDDFVTAATIADIVQNHRRQRAVACPSDEHLMHDIDPDHPHWHQIRAGRRRNWIEQPATTQQALTKGA